MSKNLGGRPKGWVLSERRKKFLRLIFQGEERRSAAIGAGYSKNGADVRASEILNMPEAQEYLKSMETKVVESVMQKIGITKEQIIEDLLSIKNRCMVAESVLDRRGQPTGEYQFDSNGAIRALHLLGKELGMFIDKKEVKIDHNQVIQAQIQKLSISLGIKEIID